MLTSNTVSCFCCQNMQHGSTVVSSFLTISNVDTARSRNYILGEQTVPRTSILSIVSSFVLTVRKERIKLLIWDQKARGWLYHRFSFLKNGKGRPKTYHYNLQFWRQVDKFANSKTRCLLQPMINQ